MRLSVRTSPKSNPSASQNFGISPTGAEPYSKPGARFLLFPPIRGIFATSRTAPLSPIAIPHGRPTASPSPTSPMSPANTNCASATRTGSPPSRHINLGNPPSFFYSPTWSPDSKKIAYGDKRCNCGMSISRIPRPNSSTPTISDLRSRLVQSDLVARQQVDRIRSASFPADCMRSLSTRWIKVRRFRSPTA